MSEILKGDEPLANPANLSGADAVALPTRRRIPMSVPLARLEVPEGVCPGYHLHWFLGTPNRLQRAQDGGYEFVNRSEVYINNRDLAGDVTQSGNTDLGDRVSIVDGDGAGEDGQASRLYLMKIREEWYNEDQAILARRNAGIAAAITAGAQKGDQSKETAVDMQQRYLDKRTQIPDLFRAKH
jgi:hypothetical protein